MPPNTSLSAVLNGMGTDKGDICERMDECSRRWAENGFQLLVDSITDCALILLDREGRFASWNAGAQRISGYGANEAVGLNRSIFYPARERDGQRGERVLQQAAAEGRAEDNGWRVRKDGSTYWANVTVTAIRDASGELLGYASLARDMTELHRIEAELTHAKAAAEAANQSKSEFLSSMSHELRTPLNAILGFAQLIQSDVPAPTPSQKVSLDQILQAGWFLLELINEILDLSLIETGRVSLSAESVSLADVISDCQAMMEPLAHKRGITMTFPGFDTPCFALVDRTRLRQVLVNLLSNAIKYNRPNGSILVECAAGPSGRIRLSVTDTGLGLPPEKLGQLFQPFNRLGQEAGPEQGTGIGLVVAKRLVEAMHGSIGAESRVGVGTTFWIELLAVASAHLELAKNKPAAVSTISAKNTGSLRTVLCVEDNPANLKLVEMLIGRRSDLRLVTAGTGNLGVSLASAHLPDAIIMDINLPDINGVSALSILRKHRTTAHIPVIALSANANPHDIERGLAAGFFRYLTKPIKIDVLMEALDLALTDANRPVAARAT